MSWVAPLFHRLAVPLVNRQFGLMMAASAAVLLMGIGGAARAGYVVGQIRNPASVANWAETDLGSVSADTPAFSFTGAASVPSDQGKEQGGQVRELTEK